VGASPLDEHRDRNARGGVAAAASLREAGVEYVYFQPVSIGGRVLAKLVPLAHFERIAERGVQFHGSATADLISDRHGTLLGAGPDAGEFVALPDLDTLAVLPWDGTFARAFCRLYRRGDAVELAGEALPTDPRGHLARVHEAFTARTGLALRSGCEPEMTWLGESIEVKARPNMSPAYNAGALDTMRPVAKRVIEYCRALGLDMVEGDYEDTSQLELNFMFGDCLATADRLTTYRQVCVQVARELGVTATFMPKPFPGVMGNGCHHNLSLWRTDENTFLEPGRRELHLSDTARHALGGILEHTAAMTAIMAPTVNSYARYWDAGLFAPALANWGFDNRSCAVRVSASGRLEFKVPDAAVNPYLSHAVLLAAIEDGLTLRIDPGEPESGSSYDTAEARFGALPRTLGQALELLRGDPVVCGALPSELLDVFLAVKDDEWALACAAVTDWHRDMYLNVVP
jgi:glutamine synthetase